MHHTHAAAKKPRHAPLADGREGNRVLTQAGLGAAGGREGG